MLDFTQAFLLPPSPLPAVPSSPSGMNVPYDDQLRNWIGKLGHSPSYLAKRINRTSVKIVVFSMTMYYWPFDKITSKQANAITTEVMKYGKLSRDPIPYSRPQEDWESYLGFAYSIQDWLMVNQGYGEKIVISDSDLPFDFLT